MQRLPYEFACRTCGLRVMSPDYALPQTAGCSRGAGHDWMRMVDARRVAWHEAGHAIAAIVLLGAASLRSVRMDRPGASDVVFTARPATPEALLVALAGPAVSARVGDARDGTEQDLREFRRRAYDWIARSVPGTPKQADRSQHLVCSVALALTEFGAAADQLVAAYEPAIDRFAAGLLTARQLDGTDLQVLTRETITDGATPFSSTVLEPGYPVSIWRRSADWRRATVAD